MTVNLEPVAGANNSTPELPLYLHRRGRNFYFKRKVPVDVKAGFPDSPRQVWKSLETSDIRSALTALERENKEFERICAQERAKTTPARQKITKAKERQPGTTKYLLPEHIPVILQRFEHSFLAMDDEERRELKSNEDGTTANAATVRQQLDERVRDLEEFLREYQLLAAVEGFDAMGGIAADLLQQERLVAPPGSIVEQDLLKLLLYKEIEILTQQIERLRGRGKPTPSLASYPIAPRQLPTLRDVFLAWRRKQSRVKTVETYERFVAEFEALCGALPVVAIRPEHARAYRDWLLQEGKASETAKNRIGALATLIRFAKTELADTLQVNAFETVDLSMFPQTKASEERRAYDTSELAKLFNSQLYTGGYEWKGQTLEALYWAPLMGPFIGARIEELAQLRLTDIRKVQGAWCVLIAENYPDQHVKTVSSFRRVPIHQELIRCGLLAYAASQKMAGHSRLFPSLRNGNKYQVWSNALSKRFGAYLDRIGLTDLRLDFHSFRYSFRQQCTLCGIENEVRDALSGHWLGPDETGRTYLKAEDRQYPFPALVEAVSRLKYDDMKLTHLYVGDPWKNVDAALGLWTPAQLD